MSKLIGRICAAGNLIGGVSERTASGSGPLRVMAGTEDEAIHVEVMPSGTYVIQIVDVRTQQPSGRLFVVHESTGSGRSRAIRRKRITGKLTVRGARK